MTQTAVAPSIARDPGRIAWPRFAIATMLSALLALAATELVYFAASAAGLVDRGVILPSLLGMGPLSAVSVAFTGVAASIGAGILLAALTLTTRRHVTYFRIVTTGLALLSIAMPATIPGPPAGMRVAMASMHVAVWAGSITVLAGIARSGVR